MKITRYIPNTITLLGLLAGMCALFSAAHGLFFASVSFVALAAICDVFDGLTARLLDAQSPMGELLDSLCDLVNFGVVPVMIMALWAQTPAFYWPIAGLFSVCAALRLARFVVDTQAQKKPFFIGLPAPAAALFAFLPLFVAWGWPYWHNSAQMAVVPFLVFLGVLMVSQLPSFSFKSPFKIWRKQPIIWIFGILGVILFIVLNFWQATASVGILSLFLTFILGYISSQNSQLHP